MSRFTLVKQQSHSFINSFIHTWIFCTCPSCTQGHKGSCHGICSGGKRIHATSRWRSQQIIFELANILLELLQWCPYGHINLKKGAKMNRCQKNRDKSNLLFLHCKKKLQCELQCNFTFAGFPPVLCCLFLSWMFSAISCAKRQVAS